MRDRYFRRVEYRMPRLPDAPAKVNLFVIIKKLLVKATKLLQKFSAEQKATPGLPIHFAFCIAFPSRISVGKEAIGHEPEGPHIKRRNQISPGRWKRPRRFLVGAIRVVHSASKSPG